MRVVLSVIGLLVSTSALASSKVEVESSFRLSATDYEKIEVRKEKGKQSLELVDFKILPSGNGTLDSILESYDLSALKKNLFLEINNSTEVSENNVVYLGRGESYRIGVKSGKINQNISNVDVNEALKICKMQPYNVNIRPVLKIDGEPTEDFLPDIKLTFDCRYERRLEIVQNGKMTNVKAYEHSMGSEVSVSIGTLQIYGDPALSSQISFKVTPVSGLESLSEKCTRCRVYEEWSKSYGPIFSLKDSRGNLIPMNTTISDPGFNIPESGVTEWGLYAVFLKDEKTSSTMQTIMFKVIITVV